MNIIPEERNEEQEGDHTWEPAFSEADDQDEAPSEVTCPDCRCPVYGCRCESGWGIDPDFFHHPYPYHVPPGLPLPELDEEPWPE